MEKLVCKCNLKYRVIFGEFFYIEGRKLQVWYFGTASLDEYLLSLVMLIPTCVMLFRVLEVGQQRD